MEKIINQNDYISDMTLLYEKLPKVIMTSYVIDFDCIVCLKRSGFILGSFLSNQGNCPLYSSTELNNIPLKFKNILLIDDKIKSGKSINKILNKLLKKNHNVQTATLYVEGNVETDYFIKKTYGTKVMWYEKCR